jgi:hypothetical protein
MSFSFLFSVLTNMGLEQTPTKKTPRELFSTGTFVYVGSENASITRTKTKQIENAKDFTVVLGIKWINDYTYVLTQRKISNSTNQCFKRGSKITTIVTEYDENSYTCTYDAGKCGSGAAVIRKISD